MSSSATFLIELSDACGGGGIAAAEQRQSHEDNVTWFRFILDTREDGRLVPKRIGQRKPQQLQLSVCHVWQADSVVAMETESPAGWSYTVRLPRKSPDSDIVIKDVFAIALKIDSGAEYEQFLRNWRSSQVTDLSTSVPTGGSSQFYKIVVEVDAARDSCSGLSAQPVVCIREVLNDVHLFLPDDIFRQAGRTEANNATDGLPTEQLLVIEFTE